MNQLANAIQSENLSGSSSEIIAEFGQSISLPHNHELWTYNGVCNVFGPEVAEGLSAAMEAAGLKTAVIVFASRGFDLSLDLTQQQLDAIAAGAPQLADACQALKLIGRPVQSRWQKCSLPSLPSENAVTEAQQMIVAQQQWASIINLVHSLQGSTVAEIKAAVAAWEG